MVSLFEMQDIIEADIHNQKMNFSMVGKPFNGLYDFHVDVTSIISNGHITNNLASIYGYFLKDKNIETIENLLNLEL